MAKVQKASNVNDFAVIATGGKQYTVSPGDMISIEKIEGVKEGEAITFDQVLLSAKGGAVTVGTPTVPGAKVEGTIEEAGRGKKVVVIRYKQKSRYFKKNGHRQPFLRVKISKIA